MPRLFDGTDDEIRLLGPTTHPLVGFDMGPSSLAIVFKPVTITAGDTLFGVYQSGSSQFAEQVYMNTGNGFNISNGSTGHGYGNIISTNFGWYLMIVTKPEGSTATRFHRYQYQDNSWFHGDGLALADSATPITSVPAGVIGADSDSNANFHVAAIGLWTRVLSDAECEQLPLQITSWLNLPTGGPAAVWTFSQSSASDPILDLTGRGFNQSSITGTTVSSEISPINEGTYQYFRPTAVDRTPTVGSPTVSVTLVEAEPDAIERSATVGEPTVDLGPEPLEFAPDAIVRSAAVGGPTVSLGDPPTYRLLVPTVQRPMADAGMWRFYSIDTGQTLVKEDGTWRLTRTPRDDLVAQFEGAYRGGYEHVVDALTAVELIRDGFEDALTPIE
jgi:hypothetical protein